MHTVALVVYPQFQALSLSVGSVFECANLLHGAPVYGFTLVSESGGAVISSQGFSVNTEALGQAGYDTIIVSGYLELGEPSPELLTCLSSASSQSELFGSAEPAAELPVHPALSALEALHADDLTPKQALDALYQLKELLDTPV